MRWAWLLCGSWSTTFTVATAADVFDAATVAGASALRRDDIGRQAV
jgi:cytosine/adenosine deaminase-related metal-dependent hydrolase